MATPDKAAVLEAMRSDLGVGRVDDLDLENGRRGASIRPGQAGRIVAVPPPPPKKVLPIASKWKDAIARGDFDDEDADAVKNLDKIGGGRLHALNKPPTGGNNLAVRHPPPFSGGMHRMSGGYPPTPDRSIRGPPASHYNSPIGVTSMGIVPNGPVRRFGTGSSPANPAMPMPNVRPPPTISPRPVQTRPPTARPQPQPSTLPRSPMPPTPPRDVPAGPQVVRPRDPEPETFSHKADVRIGDRLAKGQGIVYLLESSPTDTGTISIYLEGSKYLEYPVLSMFNYITNSQELCPQFKESNGAITTTSLGFASQEKVVNFMKAIRTLKARKSSFSFKPPITPRSETMGSGAVGVDAKKTKVPASPVPKNGSANQGKTVNQPSAANTAHPQPVPSPKQPEVSSKRNTTEKPPTEKPIVNKPLVAEALAKVTVCEVTNDLLLDLSSPTQVPSGKAARGQVSTYALDLGSLEAPACSPAEEMGAEKEEAHVPSTADTPNRTSAPADVDNGTVETPNVRNALVLVDQDANPTDQDVSQIDHNIEDVEPMNREIDQMTEVQLVSAIENLRGYLLSILPTFEDMCRVLASVDEADRQIVAKTVYASVRNSSHGDVAESEASAKQVLMALLSQAGNLEKRKAIEARPDNRTKYTPGEIFQLRTQAISPPPRVSSFAHMLRVRKYATPHPAPAGKDNAQDHEQNLKPKNNQVVVAPRSVQGHTRGASSQANIANAPTGHSPTKKGINPEAPEFNGSNIDNITAALAAVSLTGAPLATSANRNPISASALKTPQADQKPEHAADKKVKGLSGSRWADGSEVKPTSANRFTGINLP